MACGPALACLVLGLCFPLVALAALPLPQLTALSECELPPDLLTPCRPDLPVIAYRPCRPLRACPERALSNDRVGAISSTADQSRSVVSAVLADTGALSLAK